MSEKGPKNFLALIGLRKEKKPSVEEAITAWEKDRKERNKLGHKIVRGLDGKPVEAVLVKRGRNPVFGLLINGQVVEEFQMGKNVGLQTFEHALGKLMFEQFLYRQHFNQWYDIRGLQRLDAQVNRGHQGFLFGQPGAQPETIPVRNGEIIFPR